MAAEDKKSYLMLIDGKFVTGEAGMRPVINPANGALVSRKVAPAMIAGDTIVLKPHEDTPLSALEMARIFVEAGVPGGVVNIITGRGEIVGEVLCTEPGVDLITMTGSVPTGKRIMANASRNLAPVSLELGGKAPFIVLADASRGPSSSLPSR